MKKVCSLITALALSCGLLWNTAIAASDVNEAAFELSSLGIIQGDENGELRLDERMTRAEFAKIITMLRGGEAIAPGSDFVGFLDVNSDNWAYGYIGYCKQAGFMQGDGDGYFRPNDDITLEECIKTMVVILGYEVAAAEEGGYPAGYCNIAAKKGMLKSISADRSEAAIRRDIVMLVYNSLDIPALVSNYSSDASYREDSDETLRKQLENMKDMKSYTGIVTASSSVWLNTPVEDMTEEQLEIDGVLYDCGIKNAGDYIGQEVRIYYRDNDNMRRPLICNIEPTARNSKTVLENRDVYAVTQKTVEYWREDKKREANLESDVIFVYNHRVEPKLLPEFSELTEGKTVLLDNDGNHRIDYVFVENYKSYVVENASKNGNLKLKYYHSEDNVVIPKYRNIQIDIPQENTYYIENADGGKLSYDDIEKGDVVSVFENNSDSFVRIVAAKDKTLCGKVVYKNTENENVIRLDGSEELYRVVDKGVAEDLRTGETYTFALNYLGEIVYAEKDGSAESGWRYGCIYRAVEKDFESVSIQLLSAGKVENREEVDLADRTNKDTVPVTICKNEDVINIIQKEKFSADGERIKPEALLSDRGSYVGVPVRYTLTSKNELGRIETLEYASGNSEMQYNAKEKVFAKKSGLASAAFLIDENTQVICVPSNPEAGREDMLTRISVDNKDELLRYNVHGYELDRESGAVKLMVLRTEMKADAVSTVQENSAKMALLESAALSVNDEGEEYMSLKLITGSEIKEIKTLPLTDARENLRSLRSGDFIFYSDDADGNLDAAIISENMNDITHPYYTDEQSLSERAAGYVSDLRLNKLDAENLRKVHELDLIRNTDGDTETFLVPVSNYPDIFIYNLRRQTVEAGSIDEIVPYATVTKDAEKVFLVQPKGTLRAMVIIR